MGPSREPWIFVTLSLVFGLIAVSGMFPAVGAGDAGRSPGAPAPRPALPPADLVRLDNPSQAAIVRHQVEATLDPPSHHLAVVDSMLVIHAPGVPAATALPFLLWKGLEIQDVGVAANWTGRPVPVPSDRGRKGSGASAKHPAQPRIRQETAAGLNPRAFWRRPPYDELEGFDLARQVDLFLEPSTGVTWPETLLVILRYAGTVMDSLRPPKAAYARSFDTTNGLITEQGAYLSGGTFWVPTRPDEVFTFTCRAHVPDAWRAVSQGGLAHSEIGPGPAPSAGAAKVSQRTDVWNCPHPMDELYLVAGPWTLHERDHDGVAVQTFTYANSDSALYTRYLDGTGRYLDLYGGLIGPYPFEKFALVENFWQTGFGMPSFTLLGDRVIRLPFILDTSYGHEILHNWWGNSVFVDAEKGNWCEGLTVYGADYLYKMKEGPQAAREYRLGALSGYLDYVSKGEDVPLVDFRERHDFATQAIGYSKSMMVINELRRRVGEDLFWKSLRDFYEQNLWRRASWSDLLESFHKVAGVEPGPFLHQWIERAGAPQIGLAHVSCEAQGKGWKISATLSQTLADGSSSGEPFSVVVPVRVSWTDRDSTWQVPLDGWSADWSVTVDQRPARLQADPDFEMMRRIQRSEIPPTLSRTLGADTITVVIARDLPPNLDAAYRALAAEWSKGQTLTLVDEKSLPEDWTPPTGAWYLGWGPAARRLVARLPEVERTPVAPKKSRSSAVGGWRIAGQDYPDSVAVVLTGTLPEHPERSWTLIATRDPAAVAIVGSKVPHYGKYSYLVFLAGRNSGHGVWTQVGSPMSVDLGPAPGRRK